MKKILQGSAVLLIFSLAVALFQISCKKDSFAQDKNPGEDNVSGSRTKHSRNNSGNSNKMVVYIRHQDPPSGGQEEPQKFELRRMNLTGGDDQLIAGNSQMDAFGYIINKNCSARLFNNGTKVLFTGFTSTGFNDEFKFAFFTCNINGTNIVKLKEGAINETLTVQDIADGDDDDDHDDD